MDGNITKISFYDRGVTQVTNAGDYQLEYFLDDIKNGKWEDLIHPIRVLPKEDKEGRKILKKSCGLPAATISGTFKDGRTDADLLQHSGFIAIDADDVEDLPAKKERLKNDPRVYSVFMSVSGYGLCIILKVNPTKHIQAYLGASKYFHDNYGLNIDNSARNISRARFVSHDDDLYFNPKAKQFAEYITEKPLPPKVENVVHIKSDFEDLIKHIVDNQILITPTPEDYLDWVKIGFAFANEFGEAGRQYFHAISQFYPTYTYKTADEKFDNCLATKRGQAKIGTFYYICRKFKLPIHSEGTKKAYSIAQLHKKAKQLDEEASVETIVKHGNTGKSPEEIAEIVKQVRINDAEMDTGDTLMQQLVEWLTVFYPDILKNTFTGRVEYKPAGEVAFRLFTEEDEKTIWQHAVLKDMPALKRPFLHDTITSGWVNKYNPIEDFFKNHSDCTSTGNIERLFGAIDSGSPEANQKALYFGTKWLIGAVAGWFGRESPLTLVIAGEKQGTGKTRFLTDLLPEELEEYWAPGNHENGKDSEILITQTLLVIDDEFGGKNKTDSKHLKKMSSISKVTVTIKWEKFATNLKRKAAFAGTTNDLEILNDYTGNRRIIIIPVKTRMNWKQLQSIDRVELWMEVYRMYQQQNSADEYYKEWDLTEDDIAKLKEGEEEFEQPSGEKEWVKTYYIPCEADAPGARYLAPIEIQAEILSRNHGLSSAVVDHKKIGNVMKPLGFKKTSVWVPAKKGSRNLWVVKDIDLNKPRTIMEPPPF